MFAKFSAVLCEISIFKPYSVQVLSRYSMLKEERDIELTNKIKIHIFINRHIRLKKGGDHIYEKQCTSR